MPTVSPSHRERLRDETAATAALTFPSLCHSLPKWAEATQSARFQRGTCGCFWQPGWRGKDADPHVWKVLCRFRANACSSNPDADQEGAVAPTLRMKERMLGEVQQPSCKQHTQDLHTLISLHMHTQETGDAGSIPGWERCPGEGNGNSLQCSCLENPMDRRAWRATVHGATKSQTRLSTQT